MKFYLTDTNKYMSIEMRKLENGQWSPDCFGDMEVNVPSIYQREDGGNAYLVTSAEFQQIVDWWENECRCMRDGEVGEMADYSEDGASCDMHLFVE